MSKMKDSKCLFCKTGIVLGADCTKIVGHVFCDVDAWSEGVSCTADGCSCYINRDQFRRRMEETKREAQEEAEAKNDDAKITQLTLPGMGGRRIADAAAISK